jgi:hypothetical protein
MISMHNDLSGRLYDQTHVCAAGLLAGAAATQPPAECVEELSSCLLEFYSPHVLPYAAAAIQALQGRSTADITCALVPNGVLPLVGRPENLKVCLLLSRDSSYACYADRVCLCAM